MNEHDDDQAMTANESAAWLRVGVAMGMPVDELGHPYRQGKAYELDGQPYHRLHDFNPYKNPADALRVQVFFNLSVDVEPGMVVIREDRGPILNIVPVEDRSLEGTVKAVCIAITEGAAKQLARRDKRDRAGAAN